MNLLESWFAFMGIAYPLVIVGLLVDRYWLEQRRLVDGMIKKMKDTGYCVLCKRPVKIERD